MRLGNLMRWAAVVGMLALVLGVAVGVLMTPACMDRMQGQQSQLQDPGTPVLDHAQDFTVLEGRSGAGSGPRAAFGPAAGKINMSGPGDPGVTRPTIPGAMPSREEELWVIQRGPAADQPAQDLPGTGALMTRLKDQEVPVPLKHTAVQAAVAGYIATVDVTQQFHNPYSEKIEAVYVFPLPADAGINEFVMTVGDRKIRGIIRDRAEAEKIYAEAKSQGYVASLMTQERPNIFTQKVANIEPGKQIDIAIRYFHTLTYTDGWYEWHFPMVVGPRYNPADITDGVGAVAHGATGISGQKTEVQYLKPNERSGHDVSLAIDIDAGVAIEAVQSANHKVQVKGEGESKAHVDLAAGDTIPNKDFVLKWKVAGKTVKSALVVHQDPKGKGGAGGYFTLMLYPPEDLKSLPRRPVEMVFVVDTSGSMSGAPLEQCKAAMHAALKRMVAGDTFRVVRFDSVASELSPQPLPVTPENTKLAMDYVHDFGGGGGTEMIKGLRLALSGPRDDQRSRIVPFMTDGYIGNETQILRELREKLADTRLFSFGVGSSPNRYLLDGMARVGHGAVAYLGLRDDADALMAAYFDRISHPALANVQIQWGGMKVSDVYPQRAPDLFVGRPMILTGRFEGQPDAAIKVTGTVGRDQTQSFTIPVAGATANHPALPVVWARMKIADLYDHAFYDQTEVAPEVKKVALEYGIMSPFTAFVAVDSLTRTTGDHGTTVVVPVNVPEGVRYDTTVQGEK